MEEGTNRKYILFFLFIGWIMISGSGMAQKPLLPVQRSLLLSGNFGELRATHFHSGIDIRTGGMEGLPVVCVKDGCLVRAAVSPTGYGRVLYIAHEDGTTTVYGHLQRFVPQVESLIREVQYQKESFKVDEDFRSFGLFFHQGDTIGYSGNTGSSGGPHLHFEIRNTYTERTLNPLRVYTIRDNRPPVVKAVYLYVADEAGRAERIRTCPLKALGNGRYEAGMIPVPAGNTGLGVFATDYMEDSWNKLGIYEIRVMAGEDTLFRLKMDSCDFAQGRWINEIKDFARYKKKETVYRCFGNYIRDFIGVEVQNKGYIHVEEQEIVPVEILLSDINGNQSRVRMRLKGGKLRETFPAERILRYDRPNLLELPGARVELDSGSLFTSVPEAVRMESDSAGAKVYVWAEEEVPLLKKGRLFIEGDFEAQALIYEIDAAGRFYPQETRRMASGLSAEIGYLSRYTILTDRESPEITFLGKFPDRTLRFRIRDSLSGIEAYRGEVNRKWCLFTYDPRINILQCSLSEPVFVPGINRVKIRVSDKSGNEKELTVEVKN